MALKRKIGIFFAPYFNYWYERSVCWGKKSKGEFEAGWVIIEWGLTEPRIYIKIPYFKMKPDNNSILIFFQQAVSPTTLNG